MTEVFKWAAGLEKKQNKLENKIQDLDKKIAETQKEVEKQQQKIDDAKKKIQEYSQQIQEMDPQNPKVRDLQWEIQKYRKEMRDANNLLNIYQTELQNLQNEKQEALKKKEKVTETYNEKVDEESAKKLKEFLWGKFGDEEITRAFLEQKFTKVQEKIQEILGDQDQLAVWKKAMENAKTLEEKQELAIVFEKMQLLAQAHEAEKVALTKQVKAALGNLESAIIASQAYDTADANKLEKKSDFDQKINRTHKEARWARKKIFEQLASKDADMKLKLSFQEKKIMRQFAGVVNDIENWTRAEKKDENLTFTPSVEKVILDYIHSNPEQAARNTDEQWIDMLKAAGLVIKQENRVERRLGARGTTYLKEFAQYYAESFNLDQTQGYTAGKNIRKYFDMVRQSGGFEGMLATYWDAAESSREAFKDKDRAKRLSKRLEKADPKNDSALFNLFLDFNLDGTVAHGDSGLKSGLQIHSLYERLAGNNEAEQAKIIDNILAATNKANGLEGDAAITRDTAKSLEQLDKIQTLLKNPPIDVRYILQYGAEATDKFIAEHKDKVQLAKTPAEEKAFNEAVNKQVNKVQEDIKKEKQKAQEANDQQALQVLNELEELPKEKLRLGLAQVLEGQVMTMKQSGMGIGVNIPLQKVLKGLSFNLGASMDKSGKPNLGINLARNGSVDLSENGRFKAFGGANAGTTLATIPVLGATAGLGYTFENKKMDQSLTNRSEKTVSIGGHVIWSPVLFGRGGSIGIDRDLNKGRLEQEKNILNSISTMTADLLTKGAVDGKFKADPSVIEAALKERLGKTKKEDMTQAVKNLTMALKMYDGAEINAATTQLISEELAKAYSLAWSNLQVQKLAQKGWYISGVGVSVTFLAGVIPVVGILKFARHRFAGTADDLSSLEQVKKVMKSDEYNKELEGWVDVNIAALEKQLGVSGIIEAHKTEKDLLVINAKLAESANILLSPAIKGNIKLENGNLLIHKDTPVRALAAHLADRKVATLDIGAQTSAPDAKILNASTLESLKAEGWFTEDAIDVTKLPKAKAKLSVEKFNVAREELKKQLEKSDFKPSFDLNALNLIQDAGKFQIEYKGEKTELPAGHHLLIDAKGQIKFEKIKNAENFKIILEGYKSQKMQPEMIKYDETLDPVLQNMYRAMSGLGTNSMSNIAHRNASNVRGLDEHGNSIIHHMKEYYNEWRVKIINTCCYPNTPIGQLEATAAAAKKMILGMNSYIAASNEKAQAKVDFIKAMERISKEIDVLLQAKDYMKLGKLLLAFDGMFSRTSNVVGLWVDEQGQENYALRYGNESGQDTFRNIVVDVSSRVIKKMKNQKDKQDCINDYAKMFAEMNNEVPTDHKVKTYITKNTIAYNYGNQDDLMRPIINPHIIENAGATSVPDSVRRDVLRQTFGQDSILVADMVDQMHKQLGWDQKISQSDLLQRIVNGISGLYTKQWVGNNIIDIDIWEEKYTIRVDAEFTTGFFAQCVNHMVMIGDLNLQLERKRRPLESHNPNIPGVPTTPWEGGEPTSNTQRFEASIRGSQVALADAESKLRDTNDTQRFAVAAELAKFKRSTETPPEDPEDPKEKDPKTGGGDEGETKEDIKDNQDSWKEWGGTVNTKEENNNSNNNNSNNNDESNPLGL